jgi:hypothetical protein
MYAAIPVIAVKPQKRERHNQKCDTGIDVVAEEPVRRFKNEVDE